MKIFNKKLERTDKINLIISGVILFLGLMLIILSPATDYAPITMLYLTFMVYSLIKILEYFLTKPKDDYEELYTTIVCAIAAFSGFKYIDYNPPMVLSLTLAVWVCAMAIIKLIKIDYLHDRNDKMMYINLGTFFLFLLLGLLTSINLYFSETVQFLMLGFFFICVGILDLTEDVIRILTDKNII